MQGLTKWKQSALHPLNAHDSVLLSVCVQVSMHTHKNTNQEEEGPLGLCPFAVILIQLYILAVPLLPLHLYRSFFLPQSGG